jgi:hypothetical protein
MNRFLLLSISFLFLFLNCKEKEAEFLNATALVNETIKASGGDTFETSIIGFDFRDRYYRAIRNKGNFQLERYTKDSLKTIKDVVINSGFRRFIDDELVETPDSMAVKYSASVNSVHYFSVLPYGLNADAVIKTYLGKVKIHQKEYHKIKVTFNQDGGGEDFEDIFVYWINSESHKIDYLAYSYHEDDGLGFRFREAYNERFVNGIRFVDYNNYKPKSNNASVLDLDNLFENNQLDLLSKIELKSVTVN